MEFRKGHFQTGLLLFALQVGCSAWASDTYYKSELTGGVDSTAGFVRVNVITENFVQYSFTGSYSYSVARHYQVGIQGAVSSSGAQVDYFHYSIYIPFTLNWGGEDLRDDYFIRLSPGISYSNVLNTALLAQFGKRFKVLESLSWRPTLGLSGQFGNGDPRAAIDIIPLVFSVLF